MGKQEQREDKTKEKPQRRYQNQKPSHLPFVRVKKILSYTRKTYA
jgi:hypothetical protein